MLGCAVAAIGLIAATKWEVSDTDMNGKKKKHSFDGGVAMKYLVKGIYLVVMGAGGVSGISN